MLIGIIGTGIMGSNLAKCLSKKGIKLGLYNRTRSRAEKLAEEIGGKVYDSPRQLLQDVDLVIAFLPDDYALRDVVRDVAGSTRLKDKVFVNASTVTPMTSLEVMGELEKTGVEYVEAPVYGSADEARDCKLISMVACSENTWKLVNSVVELYSSRVFYTGRPPSASVLKLALNNIGLSLPAILAESLMLLESWGVDVEAFRKVASSIWFGQVIDRYWARIAEEKPPRFKVWMAGKDYWYLASSLKEKKLPSVLADAFASMYMLASAEGYGEKDYPRMAMYYVELARKAKTTQSKQQ